MVVHVRVPQPQERDPIWPFSDAFTYCAFLIVACWVSFLMGAWSIV